MTGLYHEAASVFHPRLPYGAQRSGKSENLEVKGGNFAVVRWTSCDWDLKVWDEFPCESHWPQPNFRDCPCLRPFTMHHFLHCECDKETMLRWIATFLWKGFVPRTSARVTSSGRNGRLLASVVCSTCTDLPRHACSKASFLLCLRVSCVFSRRNESPRQFKLANRSGDSHILF